MLIVELCVRISNMNCMNNDLNFLGGYLNFSRAIENSIWISRRAIVEKKVNAQTYVNILEKFIRCRCFETGYDYRDI